MRHKVGYPIWKKQELAAELSSAGYGPEMVALEVGISVAKARQWMNVWKAVELRTPYEVIASSLYLSINQVQRLVKAARMVGVFMPTRTRYENRKHSGLVHIAAWV